MSALDIAAVCISLYCRHNLLGNWAEVSERVPHLLCNDASVQNTNIQIGKPSQLNEWPYQTVQINTIIMVTSKDRNITTTDVQQRRIWKRYQRWWSLAELKEVYTPILWSLHCIFSSYFLNIHSLSVHRLHFIRGLRRTDSWYLVAGGSRHLLIDAKENQLSGSWNDKALPRTDKESSHSVTATYI